MVRDLTQPLGQEEPGLFDVGPFRAGRDSCAVAGQPATTRARVRADLKGSLSRQGVRGQAQLQQRTRRLDRVSRSDLRHSKDSQTGQKDAGESHVIL